MRSQLARRPVITTGAVNALAVDGSTVYAGGSFSVVGGTGRNRIAALDAATGVATSWDPMIAGTGAVYAIAVDGVHIYLGGSFVSISAFPQRNAACLSASGVVGVPHPEPRTVPGVEFSRLSPNPSRGETQIGFALSSPGPVRIRVFDLQGRVVARLVDGLRPAGQHAAVWSGRDGNGWARAGLYFVHLEAAERSLTKPLVLVP